MRIVIWMARKSRQIPLKTGVCEKRGKCMVRNKKYIVAHLKKFYGGYYRLSGLMYSLYVSSGF